MVLRFLLVLALFGTNSILLSQDFYNPTSVNTINITFAQSNWNDILHAFYAAGNEERLTGNAIINGVRYDSVGVRYKGNSSYNRNNTKNPLSIKLDHVYSSQKLNGYGTLRLSNGFKDPSFVREVLGYEIIRKYMPASLANYINVTINGKLIGLYVNVQDVDGLFLRTHFGSSKNAFFKGELSKAPTGPVAVWGFLGRDSATYRSYYEIESDYGWAQLINFLDTLNNYSAAVENVLNVDRHLWMLALDFLMVNLDSPVNFGHNYYLYRDDNGQFNPIMWDLNENFGAFNRLLTGTQNLTITQLQQLDPFTHSTHSQYPIIKQIFSNPTYRRMYVAHMKTIIEENFSNGWYSTRALALQSVIDSYVQADPNKFYSYNNFLSNINTSIGALVGITQLMSGRVTYLNSHSWFTAPEPVISNISTTPSKSTPTSSVWITARASNATSVWLGYRTQARGRFRKTTMFDDGAHGDGAAGDGLFGLSVTVGSSNLEYYIYAENNSAGVFSPKRAEYEFLTLEVATGDVVINEFMADNKITIADQNGEYDDWIELYNKGSLPMSLLGYYLSDDGSKLTKWKIPDVEIAPYGYLIVWADNQTTQAGLHANFALAKAGEAIYLVQPDGKTIVDQIIFGPQQTDISMGRYPNGIGNFVFMLPTFNASNNGPITSIESPETSSLPSHYKLMQNFPNPFNPSTTIRFTLPRSGKVSLAVSNTLGQIVGTLVEDTLPAGEHHYRWDATDHPSGLYFCTLSSDSYRETRKMLLLR